MEWNGMDGMEMEQDLNGPNKHEMEWNEME